MTQTLNGRAGVWATSGLLAVCMLKAQSAAPQQKQLTFDVASVKPFSPSADGGRKGGGRTGPGTTDPGRIHYAAIRLKDLLIAAYNLNGFQIVGPAWLEASDETTRFAVDATMSPDTTKEQLRVMLQNLLAERFKLAIHRETRDLPKYSLVVAKGGPKMKESTAYQAPKDAVPGGGTQGGILRSVWFSEPPNGRARRNLELADQRPLPPGRRTGDHARLGKGADGRPRQRNSDHG